VAEFPNYYIECTASAWDGEKRVLEAQKRKAGKFWIIFIHGNHFVVTYQMEHQKVNKRWNKNPKMEKLNSSQIHKHINT